ncbi:cytochrome c3 family protein [Sunxiuqinia dokdonensis]|uniref:Cytochrome C n=1 Tax=Sunxiuqinia dokdonensis TaxID=1409788 RepID=A0A0L8VCA8_9BACT|nr:NapC/NirT family cytochrome c [Sunxiuqinia dokdonensis]KOH45807.1 cytochrome C [Sunxiuqinia dokdonensis]
MKLPQAVRNLTSIIGASIALISLLIILFLFIVSAVFDIGSSYLGIFIYIALPMVLVLGLILIPVGILREKRRLREHPEQDRLKDWPIIDFNQPSVRNATIIFVAGTICFLILSAIGSYEAFHLTESDEFCGKLCHQVMEPEYTAYQESAHERVGCVECHVGSGAGWYVKSKLSGLYQVYSVMFNKYPKPIPTPIHSLRPARETCEECHWTEKFYARKINTKRSYLADENTTEWDIHLMMKTSATYSAQGLQEGIHWHINPDIKIEYRAIDEGRHSIPWVRYTNLKTGEVKIYEDRTIDTEGVDLDAVEMRTMDCMDCHNRPSHNYQSPANFVDDYITSGAISNKLPDIKVVAMDALSTEYATVDSAMIGIEAYAREYYEIMYPEVLTEKKALYDQAMDAIKTGYKRNIFPEMKVNWTVYPNHLGHLETDGCYRCHNDKHETAAGEVISRDCNLCHDILAQGTVDQLAYGTTENPLEFKHPVDINEQWRTTFCSECHFSLY